MKREMASGDDIGQRTALWLMVLVLLLAFTLAAVGLDWDTISTDELNSISNIGAFDDVQGPLDIAALTRRYSSDQMPLYYVLGGYWAKLTGWSYVTLRLLSALFHLMAMAWLYRLAADLFDRRVALLAALLFCCSAIAITQSHHIRLYSLAMLLATAHTWLYWRLAHHGRGGKGLWFAFFATCSLMLYTQGFSGIYFMGLLLYHIVRVRRSRTWGMILLTWLFGLALFLPYLPNLLAGASFAGKYGISRPLSAVDLTIVLGLELVNQMWFLWLPLGLGMALHLRRSLRGALGRLLFMALAMFAALAALDSIVQIIDWNRMRYFLILWHLAMIAFAVALCSLPWRKVIVPLFLAIWIFGGIRASQPGYYPDHAYVVRSPYSLPPLHDYTRTLAGKVNSQDFVIGFQGSDLVHIEADTLGATFPEYYLGMQLGMDGVFFHESDKKYRLKGDVGAIMRQRPHLLLAHDPRDPPPNYAPTRHYLDEAGFISCEPMVEEANLFIQRYMHPAMSCDHAPSTVMEYDNGMRLIDRVASYDADSDLIQVLLWWEIPDDSMLDDYNISLQLFAANGEKVAQVDRHLDGQLTPWGVVELSTGNLANVDYQLRLIVYEREGGAKLSAKDEATGESTKLLRIYEYEVAGR